VVGTQCRRYEELPRDDVTLPERQARGDYEAPDYPFKYIEERY
jgi:hypothetical protein